MIWKYTFGAWVANSYQGLHPDLVLTHFSSPRIADVLISLRAGILFWCPVVALTLPGFFLLKRYAPDVLLPAAAFMVSELYLIASWHDWAFGGGFGHRGFVECYAVLVFPLAAFFAAVAASPRRWLRQAVGVLVVVMIAHVLFFMTLYHTREISCYGLDRQALFDIFWWRYHAIMSWCVLP